MPLQITSDLNAENTDIEHELTAIIEDLENKIYIKQGWSPFQLPDTSEIYTNINTFASWASCTMTSILCSGATSNVTNYVKRLKQLEHDIKRTIKVAHRKSKWPFVCNICGKKIKVVQTENIWASLQSHEHIEQQYVAFINAKNASTSSVQINKPGNKLSLEMELKDILHEIDSVENMVKAVQLDMQPNAVTQSCLEDDYNEKHFKFNFKLVYDTEVEKLLYPSNLMQRVFAVDNISDYTIQIKNKNMALAYCLLCTCDIPLTENNVICHVSGCKHLKLAVADSERLNALNVYHSFWIKLDPVYQLHQVWFAPDTVLKATCKLCYTYVRYDQLLLHLKQEQHRNRYLACSSDYPQVNIIEKQMVLQNEPNKVSSEINKAVENGNLKCSSGVGIASPTKAPGASFYIFFN